MTTLATVPATVPTSGMTCDDLWTELQRLGVVLYRSGTTLRASVSAGGITPELRAVIATHRDALLARVTPYACTVCRKFAFAKPTLCYWRRAPLAAATPAEVVHNSTPTL